MMIGEKAWDYRTSISLLVVFAALIALYFPFLQTLFADWGTNDDYSHGYFIPFISAYMIYSIKDRLKEIPISPENSGIVLIAAGLTLLVVAKIGSEYFTQRFSLIVVLLGLVLFLLGRQHCKLLLLPILYLIFMIPLPAIIWNKISFPMQLFGSYLTEHVIRLLGIPVFREGNILHLTETTLEVVAACSGLRSLVTMFALSVLLIWMSDLTAGRKWLLFLAAAPAAIIANIIRLTTTAMLASVYGSVVAQGFLHDFSGLFTFFVGLGLLLLANKLLSRKTTH